MSQQDQSNNNNKNDNNQNNNNQQKKEVPAVSHVLPKFAPDVSPVAARLTECMDIRSQHREVSAREMLLDPGHPVSSSDDSTSPVVITKNDNEVAKRSDYHPHQHHHHHNEQHQGKLNSDHGNKLLSAGTNKNQQVHLSPALGPLTSEGGAPSFFKSPVLAHLVEGNNMDTSSRHYQTTAAQMLLDPGYSMTPTTTTKSSMNDDDDRDPTPKKKKHSGLG